MVKNFLKLGSKHIGDFPREEIKAYELTLTQKSTRIVCMECTGYTVIEVITYGETDLDAVMLNAVKYFNNLGLKVGVFDLDEKLKDIF